MELLNYPGCRRLSPGDPWIMSVPVVSTTHITADDRRRLIDPTERDGDILAIIMGERFGSGTRRDGRG